MNGQQVGKEIIEKGKAAPRITPQRIENIIFEEHFSTAYDDIRTTNMGINDSRITYKSTDLLIFCVPMLKNGFTVAGGSACTGPEDSDAEISRRTTRQGTVNKIWMLKGYLLKQRLGKQQLLQKSFPTERL